jgi:uncharacterized protein YeaO (DUF488 family)
VAIATKRAYERPSSRDGFRILVDRVWPRGVSKDEAKIDLWLKDVASSTGLRTWFGHDPDRWREFRKRYRAELRERKDALDRLKSAVKEHKTGTLVYGAKDKEHNNAVALKELLDGR